MRRLKAPQELVRWPVFDVVRPIEGRNSAGSWGFEQREEDRECVIRSDIRDQLNASLQELERKTSAQVLVLTVKSLDGENIENFSLRIAEQWKPGQKGKDNGVLIALAVQDRKYRFEIGYGLEEVLPDSLVGTIGRQYLVPYLKEGDYNKGIYAATIAVANTIASHEGVEISGMPRLMPAQAEPRATKISVFQKRRRSKPNSTRMTHTSR